MSSGAARYILALDCTAPQGSVALLENSTVLSEDSWLRGQSHAELVIPAIESILKKNRVTVTDLRLIAVCIGPGSFTGVRVGVNVARSFCYAHGIPVVPLTSLELWAEASLAQAQKNVIAVPSHDGTFFYSIAERTPEGTITSEPVRRATRSDLDSIPLSKIIAEPTSPWPKAQVLAKIALREGSTRQTKDWKAVLPLYVRASSAEEKIGKG